MAIPSFRSGPTPTVTFWGAARSVTGSMHLVEAGGRKLLLDCGLVRGLRNGSRLRPCRFPFAPQEIDAVVLSHAHVDHCGNLPNLVRHGFRGPIYCTPATRDLLGLILADSARIQEEEAFILGILQRPEERECLYRRADAWQTVEQCVAVPYGQPTEIAGGIRLCFRDAGHILGSAVVALTIPCQRREVSLTFSGDVGRRGLPFLRPPSPLPPADLVICESTYGGKVHPTREQIAETVCAVVRRTVARGGKVLVPSFSLGRTQLVVYYLRQWMEAGRAPAVPIFVDSPLAADLAEVHRRHADDLVPEAVRALTETDGEAVCYVRGTEESRQLAERRGPCIIVAASGMCDGGRIVRHLRHHIDDPRASIVLVSYQAPGTLGHRLLQPRPTVRFHGRDWNFWAEVVDVHGLSGHADQPDLLALLRPLPDFASRLALVHGEVEQAASLAAALEDRDFGEIVIPGLGDTLSV